MSDHSKNVKAIWYFYIICLSNYTEISHIFSVTLLGMFCIHSPNTLWIYRSFSSPKLLSLFFQTSAFMLMTHDHSYPTNLLRFILHRFEYIPHSAYRACHSHLTYHRPPTLEFHSWVLLSSYFISLSNLWHPSSHLSEYFWYIFFYPYWFLCKLWTQWSDTL